MVDENIANSEPSSQTISSALSSEYVSELPMVGALIFSGSLLLLG